jgi:hypothetical protein
VSKRSGERPSGNAPPTPQNNLHRPASGTGPKQCVGTGEVAAEMTSYFPLLVSAEAARLAAKKAGTGHLNYPAPGREPQRAVGSP